MNVNKYRRLYFLGDFYDDSFKITLRIKYESWNYSERDVNGKLFFTWNWPITSIKFAWGLNEKYFLQNS